MTRGLDRDYQEGFEARCRGQNIGRREFMGLEIAGHEWKVPGAEILRGAGEIDGRIAQVSGLVRNGIQPRLGDRTSMRKKPWPVEGGRVNVQVNHPSVHWACNANVPLSVEDRLEYPNFKHRSVELEVLDFSATPGDMAHHVQYLYDNMLAAGYRDPSTEEALNFALQYEIPYGVKVFVGPDKLTLPRHPQEFDEGTLDFEDPNHIGYFQPVISAGGQIIEVHPVDRYAAWKKLGNIRFLVKPPA